MAKSLAMALALMALMALVDSAKPGWGSVELVPVDRVEEVALAAASLLSAEAVAVGGPQFQELQELQEPTWPETKRSPTRNPESP